MYHFEIKSGAGHSARVSLCVEDVFDIAHNAIHLGVLRPRRYLKTRSCWGGTKLNVRGLTFRPKPFH